MNPTALQRINARAEILASKRSKLESITTEINDAQRAIMRTHARRLRDAYNAVAAAQSELHAEVATNPGLFVKPRTITIAGLKIGYQKQKGKIVIADEAKTIALFRKLLDEDYAETLIKTEESVIKNAVANLNAKELKRFGIEVTADTDKVLITPVDSALDKLIERMIEEATKEEA